MDQRQTLVEYALLCRQSAPGSLGFRRHNFAISDCRHLDLTGAALSLGDFAHALFCLSNLSHADLTGANLYRADLWLTNAHHTRLSGANLSHASLRRANLTGANLRGADLSGAYMQRADLTDADLSGADLRGATLDNVCLDDAKLAGAIVAEGIIDSYITGRSSHYRWFAIRLTTGQIILQYGCDRADLTEWQKRTPDYCLTYDHQPSFWELGPGPAIAATEAWGAK